MRFYLFGKCDTKLNFYDMIFKLQLSSCLKESINYSQWKVSTLFIFCAFPTTTKRPFPRKMRVTQWFCWQNLNCRWSGGGNCEWKQRVETESIDCCEVYCKYDQTYALDSGKPDISEFLSDSKFMVIEWRGIF